MWSCQAGRNEDHREDAWIEVSVTEDRVRWRKMISCGNPLKGEAERRCYEQMALVSCCPEAMCSSPVQTRPACLPEKH